MIQLHNLIITLGTKRLGPLSLTIPTGSWTALRGPTGCGKTSLLETIAGLRKPLQGSILANGRDITLLHPADRGIGYVPQDAALFPTMTVRENLAFAMTVRNARKPDIRQRTDQLAQWLAITHLLDRPVRKLSGGERQRVALGRALAIPPHCLLLDEPLSALDESTRADMYDLLRNIRNTARPTVLHVTHNPAEANALADHQHLLHNHTILPFQNATPPTTDQPA